MSYLTLTNWLTSFLLIVLLYTAKYYFSYFTRTNPLPGPLPFPIIGNAYLFRGDYAEVFVKLQKKYGTILEIYFGPKRMIWIGDAKLIKKLNDPSPKSKFPYRAIGSWIDEIKMTGMGMGLNNHMNSWRFNRAMLGRSLMVPSLFRQLVHIMEKTFDELESYWIKLSKGNKVMKIDLADWIYKYTNDIIVPTVTRKPAGTIRKEIENTPKGETLSSDILTSLICSNTHLGTQFDNENDEFGRPMTDEEIMRVTIETITGGTNPLGSGICFTLYNIAKNPAAQSKVHDEIDRVLGKDINRPVTYDDIIKLNYIEACFKESLRLVPVIPFIFKASSKEDTVAGFNWKAKQEFFIHSYYIHNTKAHWRDPELFIPERHLDNEKEKIEENSHLPFGGGLRMCPGRHLALTSAKIFVTLIFRKYKMELVDDNSFAKSYDLDNRCDKLELWNKRGGYNEWIIKLQRQYGDIFEVWLGPTRKIYLCRAEYFDKIHSFNTKSKWLSRMRATEGTLELGMAQRGVWLNANVDDWKYNRHFFNQVMLAPGFNLKAVDATNKMLKEMEKYWIMLGNDHKIDLCKWMGRFTIEMFESPLVLSHLKQLESSLESSVLEVIAFEFYVGLSSLWYG
ncbi:17294_t:CDS:2 [Dentiscutata erythropus]|uniref:17294_t:CDS:1 n=1 Tax=Dentiscutata erythropus TaxID=1348616 RepID=A0A9N9BHH8_9GLOM|nr:17294_t:CDS:2 [Dentiscutata erythropus]